VLLLSRHQNKTWLVVVAHAIMAAVLVGGGVVQGLPVLTVIGLALFVLGLYVLGSFTRNAENDGHSGLPLANLALIFASQSASIFLSKKIAAVLLVSNFSLVGKIAVHVCKCKALTLLLTTL
jgi:hypothetical protein